MSLSIWVLAVLIPPLLLIEGFFSGSEIALLSADKIKLRTRASQGSKRAALALELARHPERILSTTLLMTNLCTVGISALIALFFLSRLASHADLLSIAVTSPLIVLIGELIPKTIYQRYAGAISLWVAYPVNWTYWAFIPITRFLSLYTNRLSRLIGPVQDLLTGRQKTTREELQSLLAYGRKDTEIKSSERRMIRRIFDFKESEAKHALIPLVRVDAIDESSSVGDALQRFLAHRHSRMPVYSSRVDNITGMLQAADLLSANALSAPIRNYVTPVHYAAETQPLEDLMLDMRQDDTEMAVVVDEYGGAIGILTIEDIVEEIVGEISDEYDTESYPLKELEENKWLVQGKMEVQLLNEKLGLAVPEGDYETVAGFLLQQFGRIPEGRDELFFNTRSGTLKFTIRKATPRQIESVLIERLSEPESGE